MAQTQTPPSAPAPDPARPPMSLARGLLKTARPVQWSKNVLVFAAPGAAGVLDNAEALGDAMVGFVAFCLAASGTYFLNDTRDREADAQHPTKCRRPIAAGVVSPTLGYVMGFGLILAGVAVGFVPHWQLAVTVAAYVALTTSYSFWLKHIPVVDLVAIAAGFVLRAIGGATATGVPISNWFFIVASFGSLFIVAGKRSGEMGELAGEAGSIRPTLEVYTTSYLAYLRAVSSGVMLVAYCLWSFEKADLADAGGLPYYQLSIVPFAVAILRYAMLLDLGHGSTPEEIALRDRPFQIAIAVWLVIFACGIYLL